MNNLLLPARWPGVAVADNCYCTGHSLDEQSAYGTSRRPHVIAAACTGIRFVYGNWYTQESGSNLDVVGPATIRIAAAVEVSGTVYPLTFNGQTFATISPGGSIISDPLALQLPAEQQIYSRTYIDNGSGAAASFYPNAASFITAANGGGAGGFSSGNNYTTSAGGSIPDSSNFMYAPFAILGVPLAGSVPSVLGQGDSILNGVGDTPIGPQNFSGHSALNNGVNGGGPFARALSGLAGFINGGVPTDKGDDYDTFSGSMFRGIFGQWATHCLLEYGRNDISNGRTLAQVQATILDIATKNLNRGLPTIVTTITPITTSTDAWATTVNQTTIDNDSVRVAYNTWVRDGCPVDSSGVAVAAGTDPAFRVGQSPNPILNWFEITNYVESAENSGLWAAPNRSVTDAAITTGTESLTSATADFTNADVGRSITVIGSGPAGGNQTVVILAVTNSTTVTIAQTASTTVSGATALIGPMTYDGIHPSGSAAQLAAAGIDVAAFAFSS